MDKCTEGISDNHRFVDQIWALMDKMKTKMQVSRKDIYFSNNKTANNS